MNANVFVTKDYENETAIRLRKNKPNQSQFHLPPKGVKQKSDAGSQRLYICLLFSVFCPWAPTTIISLTKQGFAPKVIKKLEKLEFHHISGTF